MTNFYGVACTAALICLSTVLASPRVWPGWAMLAAVASEAGTRAGEARTAADQASSVSGKALYRADCSGCHQEDGEGIRGLFPALKGDRAVNKPDPTHHIRAVLFGEQGMRVGGVHYSAPMPSFAARLSDRDVAAIVDYERGAWGNHGDPVTPSQVARVRAAAARAQGGSRAAGRAGPNLYAAVVRGRSTGIGSAGQRIGMCCTLDPATGKVIWAIRPRPVRAGSAMGSSGVLAPMLRASAPPAPLLHEQTGYACGACW